MQIYRLSILFPDVSRPTVLLRAQKFGEAQVKERRLAKG
jgi:hypothetical protein